jgi:hypothetical protein
MGLSACATAGAVSVSPPTVSRDPPAAPGVRLSPHRALHVAHAENVIHAGESPYMPLIKYPVPWQWLITSDRPWEKVSATG